MAHDALLEIGVEEIPARFMLPALEQLRELLAQQLEERRLAYEDIRICGTPRRLAALIGEVAQAQQDAQEEVKGPPAERAFDEDGRPTKAALGFAQSKGVDPEDLVVREDERGSYVFAVITQEGRPAVEVLAEVFPQVISQLRFAKAMRWGHGSMRFARPIRWLVGLYGAEVVPFEVAGVESGPSTTLPSARLRAGPSASLRAGRHTRGHRVLHKKDGGAVELSSAHSYLESLRQAYVIADHEERRQRVAEEAIRAAQDAGGQARLDDELLDELTFLVEWPTGIAGSFDPEYLKLPEDVLVTVLRRNQKYFPVTDQQGKLLPQFVTCHNGDPEASDTIREGHERVIRPRLADAQFFFEQDRKAKLADWQNQLKRVVFLEGAGTVYDKCQRVQKLAHWLCSELELPEEVEAAAIRAADLCKADLVSKMVNEPDFSSLQGIMGGIYAELSGERHDVALAIREHYLPTSAGGPLPQTPAGRIVSLADKMDTIACCFALGQVPTGTEDPHGLRRAAHGMARIIIENGLPLDGVPFVNGAIGTLPDDLQPAAPSDRRLRILSLLDQAAERALGEAGIAYDIARATQEANRWRFADLAQRAAVLQQARAEDAGGFERTVLAATRVGNIVRPKWDEAGDEPCDPALFEEAEEKALYDAFQGAEGELEQALGADPDYAKALEILTALKPQIDAYFDEVLVMCEDEKLRLNRLRMLKEIDRAFRRIADFQQIVQP